ncbi:MAG TPA: phosphoribosylglycinamide formyltransferase [Gammaproteobacteria bacterium]
MTAAPERLPAVVLISGNGSNLQALIDAAADGGLPLAIRAVISNNADAFGLERAARACIPGRVLDHRGFATRAAFDTALAALVDSFAPRLVLLAGFMRVLTPAFVQHYRGRMLNIHPSLLPAYPGLHTHARVLAAGDPEHGASIHYVTDEVDGGPVFLQARVPVQPGDSAARLAARVLEQEHRLYPEAVRWIAAGRVRLAGRRVLLDGTPLAAPRLLEPAR